VRRLALIVVAVVLLATPAAASSDNWWFKTPGGAAYCGVDNGFVCMRPADGFWIRFTGTYDRTDIRKGYSDRYRGYRAPADRALRFGQLFYSSDAQVITCWSRRAGVTCKHYEGLSFSLGRGGGYRIFYDAPGFPPNALPLFRTDHGIRCGIKGDNLEPSSPILDCWRPLDGLFLEIAHDGAGRRGAHDRIEKAIGYRPPGFRLLKYGSTFEWRCRVVTAHYAERCSTSAGEPIFTCTSSRARLTCTNHSGHGFWASARSFYTF
jgi:hypothetical protein